MQHSETQPAILLGFALGLGLDVGNETKGRDCGKSPVEAQEAPNEGCKDTTDEAEVAEGFLVALFCEVLGHESCEGSHDAQSEKLPNIKHGVWLQIKNMLYLTTS
jgi:hypothetical protein